MENTFNQLLLEAIARELPEGMLVKRSRKYTRAVVIGRPDNAGAIILSQDVEEDADGCFPWTLQFFRELSPENLADGVGVDFGTAHDTWFYHWNDLINFIKSFTADMSLYNLYRLS